MDFSGIISSIGAVAKAVLPTLVPGAAAGVQAAEAVIGLIDKAKHDFGTPADVLNADREAFEAHVLAEGQKTIDQLRGEQQADTDARSPH